MAIEFVGFEKGKLVASGSATRVLQGEAIVSFFTDNWRIAFLCEQKSIGGLNLVVYLTEGAEEFCDLAALEQLCSVQMDNEEEFSESRIVSAMITRVEKMRSGLEVELHLHAESSH